MALTSVGDWVWNQIAGACQKFCVRGRFHGCTLVKRSPYRIAN